MESEPSRPARGAAITAEDRQAHLEALLEGNRVACVALTQALLDAGAGVQEIYDDLYRPALYEIGAMWAHNQVSVAIEHMATSITEGLMNHLYAELVKPAAKGRSVVLACVEGETHQVGIRMVADIFDLHGWEAHLLNPGTATSDVIEYIEGTEPAMIALSLTLPFNLPSLLDMVAAIRKRFPILPIIVGGQGLRGVERGVLVVFPFVTHLESLDQLEELIGRHGAGREENGREGQKSNRLD